MRVVSSTTGVWVLVSLALGCGDGDKKRPIGSTCEGDSECTSGLCYQGECLDPDNDDDQDGLINRIEVAEGSNPKKRDTDDDGKLDPEEYENLVARDTDGDGTVDVLESAIEDADLDCIVDELDLRNTTSDGARSERIAELCPAVGVCGEGDAVLAVMCREGLDSPACDFAGVPDFEADESACDTLDNDCDGETDEGCGLPDGAPCEEDAACASGLCAEGVCMDPAADADADGLRNGVEADQGSNPRAADTDGDGKPDGDEYDGEVARDGDGDGVIDARESALADADEDCLSDEVDARNDESDGAESPRIAELCLSVGACAAKEATFSVMCRDGLGSAACEYDGVAGYEAEEISCDGVDNDCDGATDEGCDPLELGLVGHWRLDGDGEDSGPFGDHGVVTGATPAPDRFGTPGQALRFASPGDRVFVPATEHPTGEVTVSYTLWVRPERGYSYWHRGLFAFGDVLVPQKRSSLVMNLGRGCIEYVGENNDVRSPTTCAPAGHWSFLAVVKAGRTVRFYLDGRLQDTLTTTEGQDVESTALAIGLSKVLGAGDVFEQFYGVLDDLRVYDRELGDEEIGTLYREGDWQDAGGEARPGHSCLHIRDAAGVRASGQRWIDVDGDAPLAPFQVYCDMTTDGGGWTLAWVYGFTAFDDFQADANAVTPRPDWPAPGADVPISKTPPADPTTPGAIDWALWRELGSSFAILSDLNDGVACEPGEGSLAHAQSGWVDCRTIADVTPTCDGVVPNHVFFGQYGPSLDAQSLYYYFDGSTADNWPTHDPCGQNTPQHVANPARRGGALYFRPTERAVHWPLQCEAISGVARSNGMRFIDPDGLGGRPPFWAECRFDLERGGWTRLSPDVLTAMEDRGSFPREYFYSKGDAFYRSPITTAVWSTDGFEEVPGLWTYSGPSVGDAVFACAGGAMGDYGVGCGPLPGGIASGALGRVLPSDQGGGFDLDAGTATICQAPPDAFETGVQACTEDVDVWVRARDCMPDEGSLIGDGGFDGLAQSEEPWSSPCWAPIGPGGYMDGYSIDSDEFPPGGAAPSLRIDNPVTGNFIAAYNISQRRTSLVAGRAYTLSFWAKAAVRRNMRVFVQPTDLSYGVFWEDLTLEPEWRRYEIGFEARETVWHNLIDLQFAEGSTAAIWIDDVALVDAGPSPCGPTDDGNLLGNGDFEQGRTCWRAGGSYLDRLGRLDVDPAGGPEGGPTAVLRAFGATTGQAWHNNVYREGVPLEAFYRHRLSFKARSDVARNVLAYLQRWDLELAPWWTSQVPLTNEWRTYTFDFMPTTSSPEGGATFQIDFGLMPQGSIELTDVRLEKLEFDPCQADVGALQNEAWAYGLTCWPFEWHWNELDLYAALDPAEGGAVRAELSNNEGGFDYTARITQQGLQLEAGHGYALRFRTKGEAARRGYTNIQDAPSLYANGPVYFGTAWKDHELAFVQSTTTNTAKLEVGFGGPRATGNTWFDGFALEDLGPAPCAPQGGNLLGNGTFDKSHVCWDLNRPWDEVRFEAVSDASTFGLAPPSMRLTFDIVTAPGGVAFSRPDLTFTSGTTYKLTFKAKADRQALPVVNAWDELGGGFLWSTFEVGTAWTDYAFQFTPISVSTGGGRVEINWDGTAPVTLWVDDIRLEVAPQVP